jgi:hypothetical protein
VIVIVTIILPDKTRRCGDKGRTESEVGSQGRVLQERNWIDGFREAGER